MAEKVKLGQQTIELLNVREVKKFIAAEVHKHVVTIWIIFISSVILFH